MLLYNSAICDLLRESIQIMKIQIHVKVVKRCRKKWNEHNLMYIYHKQCEIKQKNQWNSSNGQLHWFPIDFLWKWSIMDQNYANANAFFSDWKIRFDFKFKLKSCPQLTIRGIRSVGIYERAASGVIYTNRKPAYYLNRFDTMVIDAGTLGNISFYFNA